jgi:hypothetical protein
VTCAICSNGNAVLTNGRTSSMTQHQGSQWSFDATSSPTEGQQLARHLHVTVSQGFGGPRSSSSRICTCTCITYHLFSLTETAASASAILLQQWTSSTDNRTSQALKIPLDQGICRHYLPAWKMTASQPSANSLWQRTVAACARVGKQCLATCSLAQTAAPLHREV